MKIDLTNEELEAIEVMIENEINEDLDMITMTKGKEKEFWKKEVIFLKDLKEKFCIRIIDEEIEIETKPARREQKTIPTIRIKS